MNERERIQILKEDNKKYNEQIRSLLNYDVDIIDEHPYYPDNEYINSTNKHIDDLTEQITKNEEEINKYYYTKRKEKYVSTYVENISNYSKGKIISDFTNTEDLLNRREQAKTLAQFIVDKRTETPFNIGIFAKWGEGKTTFLKYIKEEILNLKKEHNIMDTYIVSYDASEYEEKNKIWASILKEFFLEYEKTMWFPKTFYFYKRVIKSKKTFIEKSLSYLLSLIITCILSYGTISTFLSNWANESKIILGSGLSIISASILITKLLIPFIKEMNEASIPLSQKINNNLALPKYMEKLGDREFVKRDLTILINAWLNRKKESNKRIVLVVDELDRCSEKGVLEFFQSIQLFLNVKQLIIVFAIDEKYLKNALKIEELNPSIEQNYISFAEYIDKYINMPIALDKNVDYNFYVNALIDEVKKDNDCFSITDGEKLSIEAVFKKIPISLLTPRKVKKLINVLVISKEYCIQNNKDKDDIIDFRGYVFWFIFSYFYNKSADMILQICQEKSEYFQIKHILSAIDNKIDNIYIDGCQKVHTDMIGSYTLREIYSYEVVKRKFTSLL
jgi:predicted KAP-like P-loop ATPase